MQFAGEAIFYFQVKIGERSFKKKMPELFVEVAVAIVPYFNDAVFYTKGIAEVFAYIVMMDFYNPTVKVGSVEKRHPSIVRIIGSNIPGLITGYTADEE